MGIQINAQLNDGDSDYIKATEEYLISITILILPQILKNTFLRVELKLQQRVNSAFGVLPDWFYYNFTSHGRECQRLLDLVHGLTRKVQRKRIICYYASGLCYITFSQNLLQGPQRKKRGNGSFKSR